MGLCKNQIKCLGVFKSNVYASSTGKKATEHMYVIKDLERNLLSRKAEMELCLISHVNAVKKRSIWRDHRKELSRIDPGSWPHER